MAPAKSNARHRAQEKGLILAPPTAKDSPCIITALGVSSSLARPTLESMAQLGERLLTIKDGLQWVAGWWLNAMERLGHDHSQYLDASEWDHKTLSNYAHVEAAIPYGERRGRPLTFSHHAAVYKLAKAERDRLLNAALESGWTERRLRVEVRTLKAEKGPVKAHERGTPVKADWIEASLRINPDRKHEAYDQLDALSAKGLIAWEAAT